MSKQIQSLWLSRNDSFINRVLVNFNIGCWLNHRAWYAVYPRMISGQRESEVETRFKHIDGAEQFCNQAVAMPATLIGTNAITPDLCCQRVLCSLADTTWA